MVWLGGGLIGYLSNLVEENLSKAGLKIRSLRFTSCDVPTKASSLSWPSHGHVADMGNFQLLDERGMPTLHIFFLCKL